MNRFLFLFSFISFFLISPILTPAAQAQSYCCPDWMSAGMSCTTHGNGAGTCGTLAGNVEPYWTACQKPDPPYGPGERYYSCLPVCDNVYCPNNSTAGTDCTTARGDIGVCQNAPHIEPYMSECPNTLGLLACMTLATAPPCCLISQNGQACLINSSTVGTCRTPSGGMERIQCPFSNICVPPTTSGSFTCNCLKTAYGYNCHPAATNSCQSGNQPNSIICSSTNTTNPCGDDVSTNTSCQLSCVPGGILAWGDYPCQSPNPNAIPPIPQSQLCLPGLVCQMGFCTKPTGSTPFSESCIWDFECGTCQTSNNCTVQLECRKNPPGSKYGICDGQCGGLGTNDCVATYCTPGDPYSGIRTAIGCIKAYSPKELINQVTSWSLAIAAGMALLFIVISGFTIVTSGGDSKKIASARNQIMSALFGLAFIAVGIVVLNFLGVKILNLDAFGFNIHL